MKSSHLGCTLATTSGAVIALSLLQLAGQSAPTGETLAFRGSKVAPISSHLLTPTGTHASQDGPVDRLTRSPQTSTEAPLTAAVAPTFASTGRSATDPEWVSLNPPASTRDRIRSASGESRGQGEEPRRRLQSTAPSRGIHVRVDPAAPGNSLIVDDQRATVEGVIASEDPEESEIQISIEKDPASGGSAIDRKERPLRGTAWGLTYEEELFRTKWGWAAFAEVQRTAKQNAGSSR